MSEQKPKSVNLPKLQRKIVLCLAKNGAMNVRETNKLIRGEYTSTNRAFHELEKKGIIKKAVIQEYRGRKFSKYWLTEGGVLLSLIEGASKNIFELARKFYPMNENLQCFIEFAFMFNPEVFRLGYTLIKKKGKLEPIDLLTIALSQMESEVDFQKYKEALTLLRKYPKISESFLSIMQVLDKIKGVTFEVLSHE